MGGSLGGSLGGGGDVLDGGGGGVSRNDGLGLGWCAVFRRLLGICTGLRVGRCCCERLGEGSAPAEGTLDRSGKHGGGIGLSGWVVEELWFGRGKLRKS